MSLTCAITITTHNRCAELRRTLTALAELRPAPDAILVVADGCRDETAEMVGAHFPGVQLLVHETSRGSIRSRNELAAACSCDIFVSLDDDSYPLEPIFVERVRELFSTAPRLAVATFPQRSDEFPDSLHVADFGPSRFVGSFVNSGAAIRRAAFEELGGYPDFFFHAYEEPDFALRCTAAGWQVRFEPALTIRHHFTAEQRDERRTHQRHARNEFWSVLLRCPAPQFVGVALFRAARQFGYATTHGWRWMAAEPAWWLAAARELPRCFASRQPVSWRVYLAWMRLVRQPIADETAWRATFEKA